MKSWRSGVRCQWLAIDAVWTGSRARYVDSPDGGYVAGAVENAGELGVSLVRNAWEASLRVRYLGKYPLIEDNSLRADAETGVNLRGAWKPGRFTVYAEALNIFDRGRQGHRLFLRCKRSGPRSARRAGRRPRQSRRGAPHDSGGCKVRVLMRAPVAVLCVFVCGGAFAQQPPWRAPRTADGHPDLQGMWTSATITPLERPR